MQNSLCTNCNETQNGSSLSTSATHLCATVFAEYIYDSKWIPKMTTRQDWNTDHQLNPRIPADAEQQRQYYQQPMTDNASAR